eukprot:94182-Pelagomonas_calceolata.AAC.1
MTLHNNLLINMNLKRDFRFQGVSKIRLNTLTCTGDAKGSLAQAGIPKGLPCKPELQGVGQPAGAQVFRLVGHHNWNFSGHVGRVGEASPWGRGGSYSLSCTIRGCGYGYGYGYGWLGTGNTGVTK